MPTCFLKRVLPFALTFVAGLMLANVLGISNRNPAKTFTQQETVFGVRDGAGCSSRRVREESDYNRPHTPREVDQRARILSRTEPEYTEEARRNAVSGTVVLRALFSESGEVKDVRVISRLPYGLTERAIEAARQIKFTPAIKDGRAVSQYIQIEYEFNLF
jgi:TonB family protein